MASIAACSGDMAPGSQAVRRRRRRKKRSFFRVIVVS
jgi:hypothetical protein